jgi:hypothetical protein
MVFFGLDAVIPAQAGIQAAMQLLLDSRLRGNDSVRIQCERALLTQPKVDAIFRFFHL